MSTQPLDGGDSWAPLSDTELAAREAAEFHALTDPRVPLDPADVAWERERLARLDADAEATRRNIRADAERLGWDIVVEAYPESRAWASNSSLAGIEAFLRRYVAFASEHEAVAIALWVAHAHLIEHFDVSPILTVTSAEMRSGKTRVLDCLELLVPEPVRLVIPSEAVVYTVLSRRPRPTLLLDEADAIFGTRMAEKYEGIRAVLNSGNRRGTPVMRVNMEGKRRRLEEFDVFGPKAIAGIGKLPDTISDRAVPIRMRRRSPDEIVARFRQRIAAAEAQQLAFDWSSVTVVTVVTVPEELNDRAADSWEPLIAIADAIGGAWPTRARLAAVALSSGEDDQVSVGIRLLGDIREAFRTETSLQTNELLKRLHDLDEAPWGDWYGKPLTARALARLLEPYRVIPLLKRTSAGRARGYFRSEFEDAWRRYLPVPLPMPHPHGSGETTEPAPETVTTVTSVPLALPGMAPVDWTAY